MYMKAGNKLLAGVTLCFGMACTAEAATYNVGLLDVTPYVSAISVGVGSFTDRFDFAVGTPSIESASVTNIPLMLYSTNILNISGLSLGVFDSGNNLLSSGNQLSWPVQPGSYYAQVTGTGTGISGGAYTIALAATPVPLPPALWLLASGLTGLAALIRRRGI